MAERAARRCPDRTRPQHLEALKREEEYDDRSGAHDEQRRVRDAIGTDLHVLPGQGRRVAIADMRQGMELRHRLREAQRNQRNENSEFSPANDQGLHSIPGMAC